MLGVVDGSYVEMNWHVSTYKRISNFRDQSMTEELVGPGYEIDL